MQRILTIIGARPQFIKAGVVSRAIQQTDGIEEIMLHTGQHFYANMSDIFFTQLNIPRPHIQLDIHGGSHGEMTGRMLAEIEQSLLEHKPDRVLVYGDTNPTLAGALAAAYRKKRFSLVRPA
ncbi:UDP-N-acetylglucosamine 2-epimerase [Aeromonas allosaccharophila]|uniref:UDP-N-acetylglucosamine 2-epimerase n=1 Tax=Aeromonas allosaccharophila TaxID=656 RepID=UPI00344114C4